LSKEAPRPERTSYLGQFSDEVANEIAGELVQAGIGWHYKQSGAFAQILFAGEWGTRLFVEHSRLAEARQIAATVTGRQKPAPTEPRRRRRR